MSNSRSLAGLAPPPEPPADPYEALKESARARNAALSVAGRDMGELPEVVELYRKAQARENFRFFCESYFPLTFHLAWSPDHLKVIVKIERAILHGGPFAMAMPRRSGKSTIAECACLWAILYGHRDFVALIGSDEGHAGDMLDAIKMELDGNDLLLADFPEVVYPIQRPDGIANRCSGQLYRGDRTHIVRTAKEIVLPTIRGSRASGAIIKVAGITGGIRGMKYKRRDGKTVRPNRTGLDTGNIQPINRLWRGFQGDSVHSHYCTGREMGMFYDSPEKRIHDVAPHRISRAITFHVKSRYLVRSAQMLSIQDCCFL